MLIAEFFSLSDLCLNTILSLRSTNNSLDCMALFVLTVNYATLHRQVCAQVDSSHFNQTGQWKQYKLIVVRHSNACEYLHT